MITRIAHDANRRILYAASPLAPMRREHINWVNWSVNPPSHEARGGMGRRARDDDDARRARKATANRILTILKAALNRAFFADRASSDTAWRKVKPFKRVDEAVVRYLSIAEIRRLVSACPEDFRKLIEAALYTGCRYAELTRLRYEDYNDDSGTLSVRLSKGKNRHVVLTEEGKSALSSNPASGSS